MFALDDGGFIIAIHASAGIEGINSYFQRFTVDLQPYNSTLLCTVRVAEAQYAHSGT